MPARPRRAAGERSRGGRLQTGDVQRAWSTEGARVERVDRVLVDALSGSVEVRGPEAHHLRDVLRLKPGAQVEAFDGRGSFARGSVVAVDRERVLLQLGDAVASTSEPRLRLTLAVALLKGDKLADVVRPATELGVSAVRLVVTRNCEARELSGVKLVRLRRVAQEAARQSGRSVVPTIYEPVPLSDLSATGPVVIGDPAADVTLGELLPRLAQESAMTVVTGPEGGMTESEVEALRADGALAVRLGPRVLRADTAPVAIAAALLLGGGT